MRTFKKTRRILPLLLALLLAVTPISMIAGAQEQGSTLSAEDALLTEKLEALGVIEVTDEPMDGYVTKRRMAEIIVYYMGLTSEGRYLY